MKKKRRRELVKQYNYLYKRHGSSWSECYYCGESSYVLDHCPPLSKVDGLNIKKYIENGGKFILYPSCVKCNTALGDYPSTDLKERMEFVYDWYTKKAKYYDQLWDESELSQLGKTLRSLVELNINKMRYYQYKADKVASLIQKRFFIDNKEIDTYY